MFYHFCYNLFSSSTLFTYYFFRWVYLPAGITARVRNTSTSLGLEAKGTGRVFGSKCFLCLFLPFGIYLLFSCKLLLKPGFPTGLLFLTRQIEQLQELASWFLGTSIFSSLKAFQRERRPGLSGSSLHFSFSQSNRALLQDSQIPVG